MKHQLQNNSRTLIAMAVAASIGASSQLMAQQVLEEVVITANKRESALMETGISVTAYTSETLKQNGIDDLNDISAATPGLTISGSDRITIRGVGIEDLAFGIDPGVASYTDGFYLRGVGLYRSNNFFDLERIEVLRGPQGTLYGRNTAGGAINLISKKPKQEFEGEVNLEAGNEGYTAVQGMVNVPITDKLAWRVSASKIDRDPLQSNDAGPDVDELDNTAFDTSLRANWSDTWTTDLRLFGYNREGRPESGYALEPYDTTTRVFPGAVNVNHTYNWTQENPAVRDESKTSHDYANREDEEFQSVLLTNQFEMGDVTVKYIGGYANSENDRSTDVDWSSSDISSSVNDLVYDIEQFSHELQFISNYDGKLNFIAGLYYSESDEEMYFAFRNDVDPIYSTSLDWDTELVTLALANEERSDRIGLVTLPGAFMSGFVLGGFAFPDYAGDPQNRNFWFNSELDATSYAAYSQIDYNFSDKLNLTVGLRYSYDEKEAYENVNAAVPMSEDFGQIPLGGGVFGVIESETHKAIGNSIAYLTRVTDDSEDENDWDNISGLIRLEYNLSDNGFLYGSIATGYRSGGFNLAGGTDAGIDSFDEETLTSYEVGYKGTLLDEKMNLEVAAFFYDYEDLQVSQTFIDLDTGAQGNELNNAAEAEVYGVEAQVNWLLTEQLSVSGNYAYADAEYEDFETIDSASLSTEVVNLKGNKLNRAPENKVGLAGHYWVPMNDNGDLMFTVTYSWVDEMYTDSFNTEGGKLDDWGRTDARVTWTNAAEDLAVTAYIKNIEDDRNATDASRGTSTAGFIRTETLTDPQMYGVRVNYKF